jgi:hypothetical protein
MFLRNQIFQKWQDTLIHATHKKTDQETFKKDLMSLDIREIEIKNRNKITLETTGMNHTKKTKC